MGKGKEGGWTLDVMTLMHARERTCSDVSAKPARPVSPARGAGADRTCGAGGPGRPKATRTDRGSEPNARRIHVQCQVVAAAGKGPRATALENRNKTASQDQLAQASAGQRAINASHVHMYIRGLGSRSPCRHLKSCWPRRRHCPPRVRPDVNANPCPRARTASTRLPNHSTASSEQSALAVSNDFRSRQRPLMPVGCHQSLAI